MAETLITLAGYGVATFAVACVVSFVARAADRRPRFQHVLRELGEGVLAFASLPFIVWVWVMRWAGDSQVRQVVVMIGFMALLIALAAIRPD